jgi:hypothetical protein
MSDIAYNEKDIKAIKKRKLIDSLYNAIRKVIKVLTRSGEKQIKSIATYPKIQDIDELIEIVNKLAWAYPKKDELKINILVDEPLVGFDFATVKDIPNQRNYLNTNITHINLVTILDRFDLVLFTDAKSVLKKPSWIHKSDMIDKWYYSTVEGGHLQHGFSKTLSQNQKLEIEKLSAKNFSDMINLNQHKSKSYCFVTGPSFDRYKEFNYEPFSFRVICNSTVKNDEFLEYIGSPDLVVFADPVFHFSPNKYSAVFRDEILKVYDKYKPHIIVPFDTVGLLLVHYPQLEDRLIGMKVKNDSFNFPTSENLWTKGSSNILTLYMLPVASSITDEVNIIGADGRKPDEKYFWQHSKSVQFGDLMNTVFETHPSFFRDRDYKDYYEEHCVFLNDLIEYGEVKGKKYFSLTNSYIPALRTRKK